jgi:hypothetical protein
MTAELKARPVVVVAAIAFGVLAGTMCFFAVKPQVPDTEFQQATLVAQQLTKMMINPKDVAEGRVLAESLKAMALDPNVEKTAQAQGKRIAEELSELMKDEDFVKLADQVAQEFKATMSDPIVQHEAKRFTEKMIVELAPESSQEHEAVGRRLFSAAVAKTLPTVQQAAASAAVPTQSLRVPADHAKMGYTAVDQDFQYEQREAKQQKGGKQPVKVLGKLGELKVASGLSELGLLTSAERAGLFTKLEKAGAFSTAEKFLPIVDKLGVLQFMQSSLDTPASLLLAGGATLTSFLPICYALAINGILPFPEDGVVGFLDGVLLSGTTTAGVLLIGWSSILGKLQSD